MNIAIVKAGGVGVRMGAQIPKQFVLVDGKPVIIYTLEAFESHPNIDKIVVVCVKGWEENLRTYAKKFGISKLVSIVPGGETSLKSIKNGIDSLRDYDDNNVILIHDANRPLVTQEIISGVLAQAEVHSMAVAAIPCNDEVAELEDIDDPTWSNKFVDHKKLIRIQTPDAYSLGVARKLFEQATEEQLTKIGATNVLAIKMGYTMFFAEGAETNIRLTTQDDILLFEGIFKARNQ